jgi:phosphatidylethanolamine/phosphatidyl-N-methylethanolamine N-methyltransferase
MNRPQPRIETSHVRRAYADWAPFYDFVFDGLLQAGRRAAASAASCRGGLVLDVGIGTGLELPMFLSETRVVGIDLSEPMLRRAQRRVLRKRLDNVVGLSVMDATRIAFPSDRFDAVIAPYVITTVPEPVAVLNEMLRVAKPGAELVLVNHLARDDGPIAEVEKFMARRARTLGWRADFPWAIIANWIARTDGVTLIERHTLPPLGLFTLARLRKDLA